MNNLPPILLPSRVESCRAKMSDNRVARDSQIGFFSGLNRVDALPGKGVRGEGEGSKGGRGNPGKGGMGEGRKGPPGRSLYLNPRVKIVSTLCLGKKYYNFAAEVLRRETGWGIAKTK